VSNTWVTCPSVRDNIPKGVLIPDKTTPSAEGEAKGGQSMEAIAGGGARGPSASW